MPKIHFLYVRLGSISESPGPIGKAKWSCMSHIHSTTMNPIRHHLVNSSKEVCVRIFSASSGVEQGAGSCPPPPGSQPSWVEGPVPTLDICPVSATDIFPVSTVHVCPLPTEHTSVVSQPEPLKNLRFLFRISIDWLGKPLDRDW